MRLLLKLSRPHSEVFLSLQIWNYFGVMGLGSLGGIVFCLNVLLIPKVLINYIDIEL